MLLFRRLAYWFSRVFGIKRKLKTGDNLIVTNQRPLYRPSKTSCGCGRNRWRVASKLQQLYQCRYCGQLVTHSRETARKQFTTQLIWRGRK